MFPSVLIGLESVQIRPEKAAYCPIVIRPNTTKSPPAISITTDSDCAVTSRYGKNFSHMNAAFLFALLYSWLNSSNRFIS